MAKKRMFSKDIVQSDVFLSMPTSSQLLYFQLGMNADDDGFVANAKAIMRMIGCQEDDLKLLVMKNFLIAFKDGVFVIKHWRLNNNLLPASHYKETEYIEDKSKLFLKPNKSYSIDKSKGIPLKPMKFESDNSDDNELF